MNFFKGWYRYWIDSSLHKKVWALALPMILSNLTVPLVSLVDTIVIGHSKESMMAAIGVGGGIYVFMVGCLNFLRMGTTGLTAQASGRCSGGAIRQILIQGIILSLFLALVIKFSWKYILMLAFWVIEPSILLTDEIRLFMQWRILGMPASLINFALVGWFLGLQNARTPLLILIVTNVVNIILSVFFVWYLDWGVKGMAQAATIAEWLGVFIGLLSVKKVLLQFSGKWHLYHLKKWRYWHPLIFINRDIFIRSLTLQLAFFLLMLQGSKLGEGTIAANSIILNGLFMTAYFLDGFAHAIESLCGHAIGERDRLVLHGVLSVAGGWAFFISLLFTISFALFGDQLILLITNISTVIENATSLVPYLALLPFISVWSYLLDGLFIGATRAKEMRNSMILSFIIGLSIGIFLEPLGNDGLWIAFLSFMVCRGLCLGYIAWRLGKRDEWFEKAVF